MAVAEAPSPQLALDHVVGLKDNLSILGEEEARLALELVHAGQEHLFLSWPVPGSEDADKHRFFKQVALLDGSYPGGLAAYIANARKLLADSKEGKNPFDGYTPSVPSGERPKFGSLEFDAFEARGVAEARSTAFVLVAGGLGERLGYSGIKIALPSETTTGRCFLQLFIESILALQDASNKLHPDEPPRQVPFVIMTSDDTHQRTLELLESNAYFGFNPQNLHLLKQEKVACLSDNEASLAVDPKDKYAIQTKPHGHGDVHSLLYSSGLLPGWESNGVKWVLFFQDTNGLLYKAVPCSLGVSAVRDFDVNSLAVPRKAKEAIGGIARLKHRDGREMVINVEYNQLDPLLRATQTFTEGDANDPATGFSPFPGNINQLVMKLKTYREELHKTKGAIPEFVNPKYADSSRTKFKSSTRLECMMQDFPKSLGPDHRVGFTELDVWLAYSPVKNNVRDAIAKVAAGTPAHSATTGEMHIYRANGIILREAGVAVEHKEPSAETAFAGQEVPLWPRIVWYPKWALTFADVKQKVKGANRISAVSTLVLELPEATIDGLRLDGALLANGTSGKGEVSLRGDIHNKGWRLEAVDPDDPAGEESIRMRGFVVVKEETAII